MTRQEAIATITNAKTKEFVVHYEDGTRELRLFVSDDRRVCQYRKGARRYGYEFNVDEVMAIMPKVKKTMELTPRQREIADYQKKRKLILSETHPKVWRELVASYQALTDEQLDQIADRAEVIQKQNQAEGKLFSNDFGMAFYDAIHQVNSKAFIDASYKRLAVTSVLPKYWDKQKIVAEIKDAMDNGKEYRQHWTNGYDYSVSVENGKAFLSQEFRGCGNGHYYLLLNANVAIYCERD